MIDAYNFRCAVCGLKIFSPSKYQWEVEAAHIVPYCYNGKDDLWNGLALCSLHHWAFDSGWFSLLDDYKIIVSSSLNSIPDDMGFIENFNFLKEMSKKNDNIILPENEEIYPHKSAIEWHRNNIFYK